MTMKTNCTESSHLRIRGDEDALRMAAMFTQWPTHRHRNLRRERERVHVLLDALKALPVIEVEWYGCGADATDIAEVVSELEHAQQALDAVRTTKMLFSGHTLDSVLGCVKKNFPTLAIRVDEAVSQYLDALTEAEHVLLFLLDKPVEQEWLPDPPSIEDCPDDDGPIDIVL